LALVNDDKNTAVRTRQRAAQLSIESSRNPDDLVLAVQAASANQAASELEQLMVDCGRAYRAPNGALIWRGQQETLTGLAVVLDLGVRVLSVQA
jgi:hypothetical protein